MKKKNYLAGGKYRYTLENTAGKFPEGGCLIGTGKAALESAKEGWRKKPASRAQNGRRCWMPPSNSVTDEAGMVALAQELSFGQ